VAKLCSGEEIIGEGRIEEWIYGFLNGNHSTDRILSVHLQPQPVLAKAARLAILHADIVVIGPGSFYTSLVAGLLVSGMREALAKARIAYVVNLTNNPHETPDWTGSHYVTKLEEVIDRKVNFVICNSSLPRRVQRNYLRQGYSPVKDGLAHNPGDRQVISANLVASDSALSRHDPTRIAGLIATIANG